MPSASEHEMSGAALASLQRALSKLGVLDAVLAQLHVQSIEVLRHPTSRPWWAAHLTRSIMPAVHAVGGEALLEKLGRQTAQDSVPGVLRPLLVAGAPLLGITPHSFLGRMKSLTARRLRYVDFDYQRSGPASGVLQVKYPVVVPPEQAGPWRGSLQVLLELTRQMAQSVDVSHAGGTLRFALAWAAGAAKR